ncbi:MAG: hypothetical protein JNN26_25590 [Candidatus Obscuribacter sp.]|nr:hypothetical protein [Candidatus Obscuribacter sp.]
MTYHTPILLMIAIISLPLFLAYRRSFRIGNQAHLDLMLTRDGVARTVPDPIAIGSGSSRRSFASASASPSWCFC